MIDLFIWNRWIIQINKLFYLSTTYWVFLLTLPVCKNHNTVVKPEFQAQHSFALSWFNSGRTRGGFVSFFNVFTLNPEAVRSRVLWDRTSGMSRSFFQLPENRTAHSWPLIAVMWSRTQSAFITASSFWEFLLVLVSVKLLPVIWTDRWSRYLHSDALISLQQLMSFPLQIT